MERRARRGLIGVVALGLVLAGAGCGGGGDDDEGATATEVQLIDPGDTRPPQPTSSTTSTTTSTTSTTTTTTEAPTTTTEADILDDGEGPGEGEVAAAVVDQANYICGSRQYDAIAGGDQPDAVGAILPLAEQVVAELRPLAEGDGGRFLDAVRNLDLAIAYAHQTADATAAGDPDTASLRRPQAVDAFGSAAATFDDLGMDQCAARPA